MQAFFEGNRKAVVVLGMGGTIAGEAPTSSETLAYTAGARTVDQLLNDLPATLRASVRAADIAVTSERVAQIDSKDIMWHDWWALAKATYAWLNRPDCTGVVITHGTDTLEETAWFLSQVLGSVAREKPVVLTCAMRPATAAQPDGPQNLVDALIVAGDGRLTGVVVCVAGSVFSAQSVQKVHPTRLSAFDAADDEAVATIRDGVIRLSGVSPLLSGTADDRFTGHLAPAAPVPLQPWVECVVHTGAASPRLLPLFAAAGVDGLVIMATGNGTINDTWLAQLETLTAGGLAVRCATRCGQGHLTGNKKGQTFSGLAFYPGLNAVKSRVQLCLDLL